MQQTPLPASVSEPAPERERVWWLMRLNPALKMKYLKQIMLQNVQGISLPLLINHPRFLELDELWVSILLNIEWKTSDGGEQPS